MSSIHCITQIVFAYAQNPYSTNNDFSIVQISQTSINIQDIQPNETLFLREKNLTLYGVLYQQKEIKIQKNKYLWNIEK